MTAHACREFDPACWRCDLGRDELLDPPLSLDRSRQSAVPRDDEPASSGSLTATAETPTAETPTP